MAYTLLEQIKIRLRQFTIVNTTDSDGNVTESISFTKTEENYILNQLIEKAKKDVINYRHYPSDYDEETINNDVMNNYSNTLMDLVMFDYATEGMDYQTQHSENSVTRAFISRDKILGKVIPFCNILN